LDVDENNTNSEGLRKKRKTADIEPTVEHQNSSTLNVSPDDGLPKNNVLRNFLDGIKSTVGMLRNDTEYVAKLESENRQYKQEIEAATARVVNLESELKQKDEEIKKYSNTNQELVADKKEIVGLKAQLKEQELIAKISENTNKKLITDLREELKRKTEELDKILNAKNKLDDERKTYEFALTQATELEIIQNYNSRKHEKKSKFIKSD